LARLTVFFFETFLAVDFLAAFTPFLARLSAVRFDAALLKELTASFTGLGVFLAAILRTLLATD
jgi:hypothetical protein